MIQVINTMLTLCCVLQVIEVTLRSPQASPVTDNAHQTAADILATMTPHTGNPAVDELNSLLHKANVKVGTGSHLKHALAG